MHSNVHTAALLTRAKTWKQLICPLTDEWVKIWYIYTVEYSHKKEWNNVICPYTSVQISKYFGGPQSDLELKVTCPVSRLTCLPNGACGVTCPQSPKWPHPLTLHLSLTTTVPRMTSLQTLHIGSHLHHLHVDLLLELLPGFTHAPSPQWPPPDPVPVVKVHSLQGETLFVP